MDPSSPSPSPAKQLPSLSRSHSQITPPRYIRSQSIGLHRSSSLAGSIHVKPAILLPATPSDDAATITDTAKRPALVPRRLSVPFPGISATSTTGDGVNSSEVKAKQRPLKRRSDSLPSFPETNGNNINNVPRERKSMLFEYGIPCPVSELPENPKTWTPSQLSVYLAHVLKLTPKQVQADIMRFTVRSGLTGKRFLRLRDEDLVGLGINIGWCRILSTARERLRKECLRGRIFGFGSPSLADDTSSSSTPSTPVSDLEEQQEEGEQGDIMSYFLRPPKSSHDPNNHEEWKQNSWRRKEGKTSKGRVKGIAQVFEKGETSERHGERERRTSEELDEVVRIRRNRQSSTDSENSQSSVITEGTVRKAREGSSDVESEASSEVDTSMEEAKGIDWSQIEPMSFEETEEFPEAFLVEDADQSLLAPTPSTPSFSLPGLPESQEEEDTSFDFLGTSDAALSQTESSETTGNNNNIPALNAYDAPEDQSMPFADPSYQSRILSHGDLAYSAISRRKSLSKRDQTPPASRLQNMHKQQMSEVTDEVSAEHLSYWLDEQGRENKPVPEISSDDKMEGAIVKFNSVPDILEDSSISSDLLEDSHRNDKDASLLFAENEGNIITIKNRNRSTRPRSHSNDNLGSLRFSSLQSRTSAKSRTSLSALFTGNEDGVDGKRGEDEVLGVSSGRNGSMVVMSRTELEQMQSRMQELEDQLAASRSSISHSQDPTTSSVSTAILTSSEKKEAMSEWVRGALGEAQGFATHHSGRDTSWLGLGGWALAAGLGIGIVVGEAMLTKMRR